MAQVKQETAVLVLCWSHVGRDFVKVGKAWQEHEEWAFAWLRRIRELYRSQCQRLIHPAGNSEFVTADTAMQQTEAAMKAQARV